MRILAAALVLPILAACATAAFVEPTEGPRARVRFSAMGLPSSTRIRAYDDPHCRQNERVWMDVGRAQTSATPNPPRRLGMPNAAFWGNGSYMQEVYVAADKPFHALVSSAESQVGPGVFAPVRTTYLCAVAFSFQFEPDTDYEVGFNWGRETCYVSVAKIWMEKGHPVRSEVANFTSKVPEANIGCLAKFQ